MAKLEIVNHSDTIGARWITRVKGCLFFTLALFKEIIQKLIFVTDGWPGQSVKGIAKRPALRHYKAGFISTALSQPHAAALSSTMSLAEYLINCLGFNKPCQTTPAWRKKICLWAGQCLPKDFKEIGVWCSDYPATLISSNLRYLVSKSFKICMNTIWHCLDLWMSVVAANIT